MITTFFVTFFAFLLSGSLYFLPDYTSDNSFIFSAVTWVYTQASGFSWLVPVGTILAATIVLLTFLTALFFFMAFRYTFEYIRGR